MIFSKQTNKYLGPKLTNHLTKESLQKEIDAIEKISGTPKQTLNKTSQKAVSPQSGAGSAAQPAQPGTITEKDLIE